MKLVSLVAFLFVAAPALALPTTSLKDLKQKTAEAQVVLENRLGSPLSEEQVQNLEASLNSTLSTTPVSLGDNALSKTIFCVARNPDMSGFTNTLSGGCIHIPSFTTYGFKLDAQGPGIQVLISGFYLTVTYDPNYVNQDPLPDRYVTATSGALIVVGPTFFVGDADHKRIHGQALNFGAGLDFGTPTELRLE